MQKKIIALAVAGLVSGAALAADNVTLYGVADVFWGHSSVKTDAAGNGSSQNFVNSGGLSGSRIGFKGAEDLSNGVKAVFVLEYGVGMDTNTGVGYDTSGTSGNTGWGASATNYNSPGNGSNTINNEARQQMLALAGNFGTVAAGYLQTAGYDWACAYSPVAGSAFDAIGKLPINPVGVTTLVCGKSGRAGNALAYISPNFSGFSFALNMANGENATSAASTDKALLLSGNYANGPIAAGLVYSKVDVNSATKLGTAAVAANPATPVVAVAEVKTRLYGSNSALLAGGTSLAGATIKEIGLGGSYDFGAAKLLGMYQTNKTALGGNSSNDKKYQLGVSVPVGAGNVIGEYAKNTLGGDFAGTAKLNSKALTLAYTHALSKRTTGYAGYTRVSNDADGAAYTYGSYAGAFVTPGESSSLFALGVRHTF